MNLTRWWMTTTRSSYDAQDRRGRQGVRIERYAFLSHSLCLDQAVTAAAAAAQPAFLRLPESSQGEKARWRLVGRRKLPGRVQSKELE